MTRGFYTLGSSLLTQNRTLSAISNNIANVKTTGFKKDSIMTTTFGDMLISRIEGGKTGLGDVSMLRTADITATIHSQGSLQDSERPLDFALLGEGFFGVQGENGEIVYTRGGSFNLDDAGYLYLEGVGRVMGENGPIFLGTDNVQGDEYGNIFNSSGTRLGKLAISNFEDYSQLLKVGEGLYSGNAIPSNNATLKWKALEGSNVEIGQEMTNSIATQRILQSVSQALKMYDATLNTAVTQIARL